MAALQLRVEVEKLRLSAPFRISGFVFEEQEVVVVTLDDGEHRGRGEASGVYYLGDTAQTMVAAIEAVRGTIERGIDRTALQALLPAGGARKFAQAKSLKLKLTGDLKDDIERVRAVRAARPEVWMGVDANQGYGIESLGSLMGVLESANVSLLEQPLKRGREADLAGFKSKIPIAADESVLTLADVPGLVGRFNVVNIKLDKCGGLTEGLAMAREARRLGLGVMVGNMVGTSLAMAPAFVLGQLCDVVDLDGPIFLAKDRTPSMTYTNGSAWSGEQVWGGTHA